MNYADYTYYKETYKGTMDEADFNRLIRKSCAFIDSITYGNIKGEHSKLQAVKDAACAVVDTYLLNENGGGIASETNDGVSVSYVAGISNTKTDDVRLYDAAKMYLGNTGLMYRGVK